MITIFEARRADVKIGRSTIRGIKIHKKIRAEKHTSIPLKLNRAITSIGVIMVCKYLCNVNEVIGTKVSE